MGTNFYHRTRSGFLGLFGATEEKHIGKRSGGRQFSFRGYVERRDMGMSKTVVIGSWQDWKRVLKRGKIFDEYGKEHSYDYFVAMVEQTKKPGMLSHYDETQKHYRHHYNDFDGENWKDAEGYSFSATEFC
jgi:hypothetical protein